jgi:hypothetical protein
MQNKSEPSVAFILLAFQFEWKIVLPFEITANHHIFLNKNRSSHFYLQKLNKNGLIYTILHTHSLTPEIYNSTRH